MNKLITYVAFNCCKLAKEKGFSNGSEHYWEQALTEKVDEQDGTSGPFGWKKGETNFQSGYFINNYKGTDYTSENWFMCEAPTQAELQRWLREEHKIYVAILPFNPEKDIFELHIYYKKNNEYKDSITTEVGSYTEVLENGLIEALSFI